MQLSSLVPALTSRLRVTALASAFVFGMAGIFCVPGAAVAQDTGDASKVLATVNGLEITEGDLALTMEQFATELQGASVDAARQVALRYLVELKMLVGAAQAAKVDQLDAYTSRLQFLQEQALRETYLTEEITKSITDADLQAAYEAEIADFTPVEEISARHILVETEEEAKAIIADLDGGADFAATASEKSVGPSKVQGGSLGYFGRGQMVPAFEAAAFEMDLGAHSSEPVQTQFGWHIIKLEDKRETQPPALETLRDQLVNTLRRSKYQDKVQELTAAADVVYLDGSLKPDN